MKVKDLIALLQKEDPNAHVVSRYCGGAVIGIDKPRAAMAFTADTYCTYEAGTTGKHRDRTKKDFKIVIITDESR